MRSFNSDELKHFLTAGGVEYVSDRCKKLGISTATFYRRVAQIMELVERGNSTFPAQPHPLLTEVLSIVVRNPDWGCVKIAKALSNQATPPTIQAILNQKNLTSKKDRAQYVLDLINAREIVDPTYEQRSAISRAKLSFPEKIDDNITVNIIALGIGVHADAQGYVLIAIPPMPHAIKFCVFSRRRNSTMSACDFRASLSGIVVGVAAKNDVQIARVCWSTESVGKVISKDIKLENYIHPCNMGVIPIAQANQADIEIIYLRNRLKQQVAKWKQQYGVAPLDLLRDLIAELNASRRQAESFQD